MENVVTECGDRILIARFPTSSPVTCMSKLTHVTTASATDQDGSEAAHDRRRNVYSDYALALHSLIRELLAAETFTPHSIQQRVKDRTSLARKALSIVEYASLSDITDVVGVRVITYFADEVDVVADLVERQFELHKKSDKQTELDLN